MTWQQRAIRIIRRMTKPFRMEEVRHRLAKRNIHAKSPKCWGGDTTELLKARLVKRGEMQVSKDKKNHSRVWVLETVRKAA